MRRWVIPRRLDEESPTAFTSPTAIAWALAAAVPWISTAGLSRARLWSAILQHFQTLAQYRRTLRQADHRLLVNSHAPLGGYLSAPNKDAVPSGNWVPKLPLRRSAVTGRRHFLTRGRWGRYLRSTGPMFTVRCRVCSVIRANGMPGRWRPKALRLARRESASAAGQGNTPTNRPPDPPVLVSCRAGAAAPR